MRPKTDAERELSRECAADRRTQRRKIAAFLANRRKRALYVPAPEMLTCADGPWEGHQIAITRMGDGHTATFRVGDWFGFYTAEYGKLHWVGDVPAHARW